MTTEGAETLSQLVGERAGKRDSGLPTYEQLSERSVDPKTGYRPSANLLWKIGNGQEVKISEKLVGAIAAGLSLPLERVQLAAARQYLGWQVDDPFGTDPGDDDEVIRVAHRPGLTAGDMPLVDESIKKSRRDDASG
jgi:hypothetical protein